MIEWAAFWIGLFAYWITDSVLKYKSNKYLYKKSLKLYTITRDREIYEGMFTNENDLKDVYLKLKNNKSFNGNPSIINLGIQMVENIDGGYDLVVVPKSVKKLEIKND